MVTGLGGLPEYEENFLKWGSRLEEICQDSLGSRVVRLDGRRAERTDILQTFEELSQSHSDAELWVFLIGHASHDGRAYKYNIRGPDLTDQDLFDFFQTLGKRKVVLVAATSSSGGLVSRLEGPNRIIVAATRNEREHQPPLFLSFFLEATDSVQADSDKDGRVSLAEAFRFAENRVDEWYEGKGRIQTEHPLLSEGPGQSALASTTYLAKPAEQPYRTEEARLLAQQRTEIERQIEDLKFRKTKTVESEYYQSLEKLLVELASLTRQIEKIEGQP